MVTTAEAPVEEKTATEPETERGKADWFWWVNEPEEHLRPLFTEAGFDEQGCDWLMGFINTVREELTEVALGHQERVSRDKVEAAWHLFLQAQRSPQGDGDLFMDLIYSFSFLSTNSLIANASTVYKCEYCGRIGEAHQKNKRFCNSLCRVRAFREKRKRGP